MGFTAAAVAGAGALGAGATIYSSNKAASAERNASAQANATEQNAFNIDQQNLAPYMQTGDNALSTLNSLNTPGSNQSAWLQSTPGYNFALQQGLKSVQNSATARGLGVSGAAQKGAANYATGLASQTYQNQFNNLLSQSQLGENAAAGVGTAAMGTAANQATNTTAAGTATAASNTATGNALSGAFNSVPNALLLQQLTGGGGLYGENDLVNTFDAAPGAT